MRISKAISTGGKYLSSRGLNVYVAACYRQLKLLINGVAALGPAWILRISAQVKCRASLGDINLIMSAHVNIVFN